MVSDLVVERLGVVPYADALALQADRRERVGRGEIGGTLLLLEHPPVYTRGRRATSGELPMGEDWYRAQGIAVEDTDRGGRITYHGPGQLVGWPVVPVTDVVAHVRALEDLLVAVLAEEGIAARARVDEGPDYTGVWVEDRKIASIGVHVRQGVATHGFGLNVDNDLQPFEWIVPCGLEGVRMTSVRRENGSATLAGVADRVAARFAPPG